MIKGSAPTCPGCHAKFSVRKGVCRSCGLPVWQFLGIEDPVERGKAIARFKRGNKTAPGAVPPPTTVTANDGRAESERKRSPSGSRKLRNKHGRKGVKRA